MIIVLLVSFDDMIGRGTIVRRESQIKAIPIHVVKAGDFRCVEFNTPKMIYFITRRYYRMDVIKEYESDSPSSEENNDIFVPASKKQQEISPC